MKKLFQLLLMRDSPLLQWKAPCMCSCVTIRIWWAKATSTLVRIDLHCVYTGVFQRLLVHIETCETLTSFYCARVKTLKACIFLQAFIYFPSLWIDATMSRKSIKFFKCTDEEVALLLHCFFNISVFSVHIFTFIHCEECFRKAQFLLDKNAVPKGREKGAFSNVFELIQMWT